MGGRLVLVILIFGLSDYWALLRNSNICNMEGILSQTRVWNDFWVLAFVIGIDIAYLDSLNIIYRCRIAQGSISTRSRCTVMG